MSFWLVTKISHLTFQVRQRLFLDRENIAIILYIILYYCRKLIFELDLAQNQTWKVKQEDIVFRNSVNMFDTSVSGHILYAIVHTYIETYPGVETNLFFECNLVISTKLKM